MLLIGNVSLTNHKKEIEENTYGHTRKHDKAHVSAHTDTNTDKKLRQKKRILV